MEKIDYLIEYLQEELQKANITNIENIKTIKEQYKEFRENIKKHIPTSPFLIGGNEEGDKITDAKQKSWKTNNDEQISLI